MKRSLIVTALCLLLFSCKKEAVQDIVSSSNKSDATAIVYNTWSGWQTWTGQKVNRWFIDKNTADYVAALMQREFLDSDSVAGASAVFIKKIKTSPILSLAEPCDPISPPEEGDIVIRSQYKTYILHKNGTKEILDCGSSDGDPVSFTITFTFPTSGDGYNIPDYTVTITIWEDDGTFVSGTITMQPSSNGAYGEYTQETPPERGVTFKPNAYGGTLLFNVNAYTTGTLGFSSPNTSTTQTQHGTYLMNMSGYIPMDQHFNVSATGRAWLRPRRSK